ncbi:recombinase family protein, partial [Shewanella sp. GXUN23E]|uniref:recombinase family protein n=1 Tax=Shewanella sp. GXUN23E TaxID=3422498 RepID=UPI003D7D36D0
MVTAYSYTRLSTERQLKGHGKTRQEDAIRHACEVHGWTLSSKGYADMGVSAWKGVNASEGALKAFIDAVQGGEVARGSVLIVENVDRLSRQEVDKSIRLMLDLLDMGIQVFTLSDNRLYTSDSSNKFVDLMVWGISAQRAHEESETKSKRIRAAKAKNKELMRQGKIVTRKCPAWLKVSEDKTEFLLVPEIVQIVRRIFTMYSNGYSTKPIAIKLNEEGVPYWGKTQGWTHSKVNNILKSKSPLGYCQPLKRVDGKDVPDGEPIANFYPPIIDQELWSKCQSLKAAKATKQGVMPNEPMANLFRGLCRCECGSGMGLNSSVIKGKRYSHLRCSDLHTRGCTNPTWSYRQTETIILYGLKTMDWSSVIGADTSVIELKRQELESCRVNLETAIAEAETAYTALTLMVSSKIAQRKLQEAEERVAKVEAELQDLELEVR